ncbi:MAG: DNA/RNA nuclease SfsA [Proteobacteria bacterium]|nr:DNA/RNA nuclease SfsA [Pseudomonadota bacterium]
MDSDPEQTGGIFWPELIRGTLVKRYKRFLADVQLDEKTVVTAHCPNSGSMKACCEPGSPVYLSYHDNPRRKLKYTWEIIDMGTSLVGVNTIIPNRLVKAAAQAGLIDQLTGYERIDAEVKVSDHSRLDLVLSDPIKGKCFVEIKNCSLVNQGHAQFPDAVTVRGLKHINELMTLKKQGHRCMMFYLIQRMDATVFSPADHIDPAYGKQLRLAVDAGVEIAVFDVVLTTESIFLGNKVPHIL